MLKNGKEQFIRMAQSVLPGLQPLFTESWALMKSRFWPMLLLWLAQTAIITVFIIAVVLTLFATSLGSILGNGIPETPVVPPETLGDFTLLGPLLGGIVLLILAILLFSMVLAPFFQAATIALAASDKPISVGEAFKQGWRKFIPVFLAGLVSGFFVLGALFLFVIPGLVFAFLLSFVLYEIVLHNASVMEAIQRSAAMVKAHFWGVAGRMAAIILVGIGISMINEGFAYEHQPALELLGYVLSLGYSVFSALYNVVLYKHLRAITDKAVISLTPLTVISTLGWLGAFVVIGRLLQTL